MVDWDKLVDHYFEGQKDDLNEAREDFDLFELIEEVRATLPNIALTEQEPMSKEKLKQGQKLLLTLPKFVPTESWGVPNSQNRKVIEKFMKKVRGANLQGRIETINGFINYKPRLSPGTILSHLIVLESLAAVMHDFGAASAGFVFEGFLAALLGGEQVADTEDGSLPIQDIIAGSGDAMSLKLLTKGKTEIKGSFRNLVDGIDRFGKVVYVVADKGMQGKEVKSIGIHQFEINKQNLLMMMTNIEKNQGLLVIPEEKLLSDKKNAAQYFASLQRKTKSWEKIYRELQRTVGYTKTSDSGDSSKTQWYISQSQMKKLPAEMRYSQLGEIDISPEKVREVAAQYMEDLGESIVQLFTAVASLSDNLNDYFINDKRDRAIDRGMKAVSDAKFVQKSAAKQVSAEKSARNK